VSPRPWRWQVSAIFDDVVAESEDNPTVWRFNTFYTWNTYDNSDIDEMQLSNMQFEKIGAAVVARLLAINHRGK
jgi:hypothetical protein